MIPSRRARSWTKIAPSFLTAQSHSIDESPNRSQNKVPKHNRPEPTVPEVRRNYWAEALDRLRESKPDVYRKLDSAIQDGTSTSGSLQERIGAVLTDHIEVITERQWRIKWGARNVPIRDLLESVTKALDTVKGVGSAAAALDPIHAGLPWAGVCVLLPLVLNFPGQEDAAKTGLDKIANIVTRYTVVEAVYSRTK